MHSLALVHINIGLANSGSWQVRDFADVSFKLMHILVLDEGENLHSKQILYLLAYDEGKNMQNITFGCRFSLLARASLTAWARI